MRAMIVDDSRATRAILGRILQELGFEVVEAADGRQALERLADASPVTLALVDWNMPVMNGLEFVKAVRQDPTNDGLRLLMVTTESDIDHMVSALEAGADEYAMKPFTAAVIREKLDLLGVTVQEGRS
ncbi:response regulator [Nitriliruptor alkaliphilus]|uniref:response regulator n=1 Tax=Nitriliruptor alkaliphilus TaxID=427918 RepID=UPI000696ADE5|nr:response regulator [Nitriliruptor alkaliphilus]